jgi:hypothetical protein
MEAKSHADKQCVRRPANSGKQPVVNDSEASKARGRASAAGRFRLGTAGHAKQLRLSAARHANDFHPACVCEHLAGELSRGRSTDPIGFGSSRELRGGEPGEPDVYDDGRRQKLLGQHPGVQRGVRDLGPECSGRDRDRVDRSGG